MTSLAGRVAIVTGASSGIGAATCVRFAREGASVVIAARRADKSQAVLREVKAAGGKGMFVPTDVTKAGSAEALVKATLDEFGRLDFAVNNAGVSGIPFVPTADVPEADFDSVIDTNVKGVWLGMKYQIPAMLKRGKGAIVNVASIYGSKPSEIGHAPYCASKHAVLGLSKSAAIDYAKSGIRINTISPGFTHSEMVDPHLDNPILTSVIARNSSQNRVGELDEIAAAIVWLCGDAQSFVNGADLIIDGGPASRLY